MLATSHTWGDKLRNGFEGFFDFLPNLIAFLVVLAIGYVVAKVVANLIGRLLKRGGLDRAMTRGQGGSYVSKVTSSLSGLIGRISFWVLSTISGAIRSWFAPMVRETSAATPDATAPATRKGS